MALPVAVDVLVPLVIALFFALLYEMDRKEMLWAGITAMGTWFVSGMVFLIVSNYPVIALIFLVPAMTYLIRIMIDLFRPLKEGRKLGGED